MSVRPAIGETSVHQRIRSSRFTSFTALAALSASLLLSSCAPDDQAADESDAPLAYQTATWSSIFGINGSFWRRDAGIISVRDAGATPQPVATRTPTMQPDAGTRSNPDGRGSNPRTAFMPKRGSGDLSFPTLGSTSIDVAHYDLDLHWTPATKTLNAHATLTLSTRDTLGAVSLDFGDQLLVSAITVGIGGAAALPATIQQADDQLVIDLGQTVPPNTELVITIAYEGNPQPITSDAAPIPVGWNVDDTGKVNTVSEPNAAHQWFPTNDHPTDKATFHTAITVPHDYVAVGNGVQLGTPADNLDGTQTWTWLMDSPMAPYLALVAIDKFDVADQGSSQGIALRNYVPAGKQKVYADALGAQPAALEFLIARLGPYPFEEYGAVVVVDGPGVALETQGRSLFQGLSARDVSTVVHELAHQWMGNSVSLTSWQDDIWWVEGFARFSEWLWSEHTDGANAYTSRAEAAYYGLQHGTRQPLSRPQTHALFDSSVYDGGAFVFYQLRDKLGDEVFFKALQTFCARYRHGNATSEQLIATFKEVSGIDIAPLIDAWLAPGPAPSVVFPTRNPRNSGGSNGTGSDGSGTSISVTRN